jgi:hypothetical protein
MKIFVGRLRQGKIGGVFAQRFSAADCFADCESSGNRGFEGIREGTDSGGAVAGEPPTRPRRRLLGERNFSLSGFYGAMVF